MAQIGEDQRLDPGLFRMHIETLPPHREARGWAIRTAEDVDGPVYFIPVQLSEQGGTEPSSAAPMLETVRTDATDQDHLSKPNPKAVRWLDEAVAANVADRAARSPSITQRLEILSSSELKPLTVLGVNSCNAWAILRQLEKTFAKAH